MIWRAARIPWMVIFLLGMAGGIVPGIGVLFIVVAAVAAMMIAFSLILRLFGWVFWRNDPGYQQFRRSGGDPYFDLTLPAGINNDDWATRCGGQPEPKTSFVPPKEWLVQCNNCHARNEVAAGPCWNCGNNLSNKPQTAGGRRTICWKCGKAVVEANYGDLDNGGVICPFCGAHMVTPV
jgi:hypothetical protein